MGNTSPAQPDDSLRQELFDERYGGTFKIEHHNGKQMAVTTIPIPTKAELEEMMALIIKRTRMSHRNLSTIRSYKIEKQQSLCRDSAWLSMYFQYFQNDLEKEIERRAYQGRSFTEGEICRLLYELTDCLKYLQERHSYHGDIKANNVLITPNHGIKLLDSYFTHLGKTNLQLVLTTPETIAYLSPSQLDNLRRGDYAKDEDIESNQIFSLGMLMIQVMSLEHSYDCYEFSLIRVNEVMLEARISRLRKRYRQELVDLISNMVGMDQTQRPRFRDVLRHRMINAASIKISVSRAVSDNNSQKSSLMTHRTGSNPQLTQKRVVSRFC